MKNPPLWGTAVTHSGYCLDGLRNGSNSPRPFVLLIENRGAAPAKPRNSICVPPAIGKADMPARLEPFTLKYLLPAKQRLEQGLRHGAKLVRLAGASPRGFLQKLHNPCGQVCCQPASTTRNSPGGWLRPAAKGKNPFTDLRAVCRSLRAVYAPQPQPRPVPPCR